MLRRRLLSLLSLSLLLFVCLGAFVAIRIKEGLASGGVPSYVHQTQPARTVRVGMYNQRPFHFDNGKELVGLSMDLFHKIAEECNWDVEIVWGNWREGMDRLEQGQVDLMLSVARSPERERVMDFSHDPVAESWGQLFALPNGEIRTIEDIRGRTVGIQQNDVCGRNFISVVAQLGIDCQIESFQNRDALYTAVQKGRIDAAVARHRAGNRQAARYDLVPTTVQFSPFALHFATKKGRNHQLLSEIDARMVLWRQDAESYYYQRVDHWFGKSECSTSRLIFGGGSRAHGVRRGGFVGVCLDLGLTPGGAEPDAGAGTGDAGNAQFF